MQNKAKVFLKYADKDNVSHNKGGFMSQVIDLDSKRARFKKPSRIEEYSIPKEENKHFADTLVSVFQDVQGPEMVEFLHGMDIMNELACRAKDLGDRKLIVLLLDLGFLQLQEVQDMEGTNK
jgi:hypothetical protein